MEGTEEDIHPHEAARIARGLWGERFNLFHDAGLWHVGRFLDGGFYTKGPNAGREMPPNYREQEIFGCAPTLREALRFATGRARVYSGAGQGSAQNTQSAGYRPVMDKMGRVRGWTSPAGIFSKNFPSQFIHTA